MKMVYPYKASLYLAANRPLIVWNKCGIADFVRENHLGITVNHLYEIYDAIHSINKQEKCLILENVAYWSNVIRTGKERINLLKQMITENT